MTNRPAIAGIVALILITAAGVYALRQREVENPTATPSPTAALSPEPDTVATVPPNNAAPVMQGEITVGELARHNTEDDCWMAIDGAVYNVTQFIDRHPGGQAIVQGCGKDATALFAQRPDGTSHSQEARELAENYRIGTLVP
jgi:cytochrome b involved in lipid metabolism